MYMRGEGRHVKGIEATIMFVMCFCVGLMNMFPRINRYICHLSGCRAPGFVLSELGAIVMDPSARVFFACRCICGSTDLADNIGWDADQKKEGLKMRDTNRIPKILETLKSLWEDNPDLRLGQLLTNAINPEAPNSKLFYIEDNELVRRMNNLQVRGEFS